MKYTLVAQNWTGSTVTVKENSIKKVIKAFDSEHSRGGFRMHIENNETGETVKVLKRTFNDRHI
jgi:hypothetical protein